MPLRIPTKSAMTGMKLAEPFTFRGRELLPINKTLTKAEADKLHEQYAGCYIKVRDPILDRAIGFEDTSDSHEVAFYAQDKIIASMSKIEKRVAAGEPMDDAMYDDIEATVKHLVGYLHDHPVSLAVLYRDTDIDNYLSVHAANVFYLSVLMALTFRSQTALSCPLPTSRVSPRGLSSLLDADLLPLGMGAALCDVGMVPIRHLFNTASKLPVKHWLMLSRHPMAGLQLLPRWLAPTTKILIKTHHENFDGSGYPDGVPGDKQHVFTRIVRIADAYSAATSNKVYADAGSPVRVLWEMANGPCQRFFDPVLVRTLASLIQPFPIGSLVRLTDGRTAVVTNHNRTNPFEPTVVVAFDEIGRHLTANRLEGPITLDETSGLGIASYEDEDLSYLYGTTRWEWPSTLTHDAADHHYNRSSLFEAAYP